MLCSFNGLFAIILILNQARDSNCQCTYGDIRLVGGSGDYEGNVQVCINGVWGYVCHNNLDTNEARVVCRQLGYSISSATYKPSSYYGYGNGTIWMDNIYCTGPETKLIDCSSTVALGNAKCGYDRMAGMFCPSGGSNCNNGDIRLATFDTYNSYGRSEGRVEVCHNGQWGTVCDNYWSSNDATVACRQLGYTGYISYHRNAHYGAGIGPIWLDKLQCKGNESSLFSCTANAIGRHNCDHNDDAGVRCYSRNTQSCTNGDVTLWSHYDTTPSDEGIPLICKSGKWYPLYYYSNCRAARIACISAGYTHGIQYIISNAGRQYGYYYDSHYRYTCSEFNHNLTDCAERYYSGYASLGVKCVTDPGESCSSNDTVRLVSNGLSSTEETVEYCYNGYWAPICSMDSNSDKARYTAKLICEELGYTKLGSYSYDEHYGTTAVSRFRHISCSSYHAYLSECDIIETNSCTSSSCDTPYSLGCFGDIL